MAYYYGYQGSVKFNSTGGAAATLVQITDWSMSVEKQVYETTQINDTYSKKCGGLISGSGTVNLIYTGDNNTFIEAVNTSSDAGTALFELYLSQADTKRIVFNGIITNASYSAAVDDVSKMSCDFVTNGTITLDL
jgi:hypothetical protein